MNTIHYIIASLVLITCHLPASAQDVEDPYDAVWVADQGDGTYVNPILYADYSDPDAIRVGDDFYMTASSFNCVPGLPILHSNDLVNWELIGHALPTLGPADVFSQPQHGKGVWAPCIRYHQKQFYIYYPDPDYGIYMVKADDARGPWSEPVLVKAGKGLIDPTPLWDDDGKAYLAYAYAGSRAGIKSLLVIATLTADGTCAHADEVMVIDGHADQPTIEGPKFYKRNGYYYLFAPAGGVPTGWQLVMRSKHVYGPYEKKIVLAQGKTDVNGPHQGAWVNTATGEDWFLHFQEKGAYGRIVHLQPMTWKNDWPVVGEDRDGDGVGQPVLRHQKPNVGKTWPITAPPASDEFNEPHLGLAWQWHANPAVYWGYPTTMGYYCLYCQPLPEGMHNFWDVPNLLLQKFPAPAFTATTKLTFNARFNDEQTGLIVMGRDYAYISAIQQEGGLYLAQTVCPKADQGGKETRGEAVALKDATFYLRVDITADGVCHFSYSENGRKFKPLGQPFKAREGGWIGAKVGLFATRQGIINDAGNVYVDWFHVEK